MNKADLEVALACAALLDEKYTKGGGVTFELQAANALRLLCDEVGALHDEIAVAVAMEREACAKVCDDMEEKAEGTECCKWPTPSDCAAVIRARSER